MDIKLRYAKESDIPVLKKLWQICFGDRMRYIDVFFEKMFVAENTIIAETDNKVAGVVYLLERTLLGKKFMYGYAIGVFPEYRGNDICEKMLNIVRKKSTEEGLIFGLHPANDKLTQFYKRIGLNEMYYLKEVDCSHMMSDKVYEPENIDADEFYSLREKAFKNCVKWNKSALEYIIKNGEVVKKITLQDKKIYFALSVQSDTAIIKESNATDDELPIVISSVKHHYNVKNVKCLLPKESALHGTIKPMVLGFSEKDENVYMNLFLD
jgi:predicted acetyltransferase